MNKLFKYIASAVALIGLMATSAIAQINSPSPTPAFTTNLTISNPTDVVAVTNASKIAQVSVIGVGLTTVNIYDNSFTNTTYTNVAYTNVTQYATNVVSTFVSPLTGTTNTHSRIPYGLKPNVVVAAATNQLPFRTFICSEWYHVNL